MHRSLLARGLGQLARHALGAAERSAGRPRQLRFASTAQGPRAKPLGGKTAIVTASTEGIGLAIARRLAADGSNVVISSRKEANVDKAVGELAAAFPGQVAGTVCHVGKERDRDALVEFALAQFGRIDSFVSNAAVNPYFGSFLDIDESAWDKIFDVNVKSAFMLTKKIVPHMLKNESERDRGSIVFVSSIAAYSGMSSIGAYSVSKTALLGLCKNLANELGVEKIRVNLVAPGVIKTKFSTHLWSEDGEDDYYRAMTSLKRLGECDEVAGLVNFLCGPESTYVTGENMVVGGGYHCRL